MKILVCGDSFATLDNVHSHWADIWALNKGYNVDHEGFEGESHVNIITKTLQRRNVSDYGVVIYHVTDFLRAQIDLQDNSLSKVLDKTIDIYSDKNLTTKLNNVLFNTFNTSGEITISTDEEELITEPVNISPNNLDPAMPQDKECKETTLNFYSSVCLYWLVQANYNSFLLLAEKCSSLDIPLILAIEPEISTVFDKSFYPEGTNFFTTDQEEGTEWYNN
jgi:hypothetical protein